MARTRSSAKSMNAVYAAKDRAGRSALLENITKYKCATANQKAYRTMSAVRWRAAEWIVASRERPGVKRMEAELYAKSDTEHVFFANALVHQPKNEHTRSYVRALTAVRAAALTMQELEKADDVQAMLEECV